MTTRTAPEAGPPPSAVLMQMLFGGLVQQSIRVVAELRIADLVAERPVAISELAAKTGAHEPSLYRVLRALAAIGVFEEHPGRAFGITPVSALLRSDAPDSMRDFAMMQGAAWNWRGIAELAHCIQTGGTGQAKAHGKDLFEFLTEHPEDQALFDRAMTSYAASTLMPIVEAYAFGERGIVVDVGGGRGTLLAAILRAHEGLRGCLLDQPAVVDGARGAFVRDGLAARVEFVGGDFFEAVPAGDLHVLKNIVHDWDDERAGVLLRRVRDAMRPGGRVLVIDLLVPDDGSPSPAKLVDLQMLVSTGGGERTESEFAALFAAAGLRLTRTIPTRSPMVLVEGVAAR